jgi:hypothetical protein
VQGSTGPTGPQGESGVQGVVGATGAKGTAGNAIAFDTDATIDDDAGKTTFIHNLRGESVVVENDTYWHIQTGRIWQYNIPGTGPTGPTSATGWVEKSEIIDGDLIVASSITADRMSVTQLSAITANMGTITAGTIQSTGSGERIVITEDVITVYDSSNNVRVKIGDLS